jgi:hypothetical protein
VKYESGSCDRFPVIRYCSGWPNFIVAESIPIRVIGLKAEKGNNILVTHKICFEGGIGYHIATQTYENFVKADVEIIVNDSLFGEFEIERDWRLYPLNAADEQDYPHFHCMEDDWSKQHLHWIQIDVTTPYSEQYHATILFLHPDHCWLSEYTTGMSRQCQLVQ